MRWESLAIGIAILGFGVFLVASHGYVGSTYIPGLVGLPAQSGTNASFGFPGIAGYSVGTIVAIFGLGMIANALRSANVPSGGGLPGLGAFSGARGSDFGGTGGGMPPQVLAALQAMSGQRIPGQPPPQATAQAGAGAEVVYCSKCGRPNPKEAKFCHQCGATMPQLPSPVPASAPAPPSPEIPREN